MSMLIRCDFCGKTLVNTYKRPGITVLDERGFVASEYDACAEDASLIVMMLERRVQLQREAEAVEP
jgi:hypothetical protein